MLDPIESSTPIVDGYMESAGIAHMEWPAHSSFLNPIEDLCAILRTCYRPTERTLFFHIDSLSSNLFLLTLCYIFFRLPSPFICNCTSGDLLPYSWEDYIKTILKVVKKHPLPNTYLVPNAIICKNALSYNMYALLCHYIPAYPIDLFLWIVGSKLR